MTDVPNETDAVDAVREQTLSIPGMHCAGCAKRVKSALVSLPGVETARVSLRTHTVSVQYRPAQTSLRALRVALGAIGYPVEGSEQRQVREALPLLIPQSGQRYAAQSSNVTLVSRSAYARFAERDERDESGQPAGRKSAAND